MAEEAKNQVAVFEAARDSIATKLHSDLALESFDGMLSRLDRASRAYSVIGGVANLKPLRYFVTHYLKLKRSDVGKVRGWLNKKEAMSEGDVILVLKTLNGLLSVSAPRVTMSRADNARRSRAKRSKTGRRTSASHKVDGDENLVHLRRAILNAYIGSSTSTATLMVDAGVRPSEVSGGDRMRIKSALETICARMGIDVKFAKIKSLANAEPVTHEDIAHTLGGI